MRIAGLGFLSAFVVAVLAGTGPANACACPKEQMIKKHGTAGSVQPATPKEEPSPPPEKTG